MDVHDLTRLRRRYERDTLADDSARDPLALFELWLDDAVTAQEQVSLGEASAVYLATVAVSPNGALQPRVRTVLLKSWDAQGFVFYSNHDSDKGRELAANPWACLHFHWAELERQVRIEGSVANVPRQDVESYFSSRPRGAKLGAWASDQSRPVTSRAALDARYAEVEERFKGREVPCPPHWGGYRLAPLRIEFWQGRPSRLHDRLVFTLDAARGWDVARLQP